MKVFRRMEPQHEDAECWRRVVLAVGRNLTDGGSFTLYHLRLQFILSLANENRQILFGTLCLIIA
jgi:hypothetical protein